MSLTPGRLGGHAIVLGAGMGGMMAAQTLSRHFDAVTVIDKDQLPDEATPRMGAPQGAHAHALLIGGLRNLERLFPGFTEALDAAGAVTVRPGLDFNIFDGAWQPERDLGLTFRSMTRPLLEGVTRACLARNAKITLRQDLPVEGWLFENGRVAGVIATGDDGPTGLTADLVIDASGRASTSRDWLEAGGYAPPKETVIDIGAGYASALFEKPAEWAYGRLGFYAVPPPPETRCGFIFPTENNGFICSLNGRFGETPRGDEAAWMDFAKSLCLPDVFDWVSRSRRVSPIRVYRTPQSRWRRYEQLERFPDGLLPVGDVIAHTNPLRGQGMTLASEHVRILGELLAERAAAGAGTDGLSAPYFERTHGFTKMVWEGLETFEYGYPGVTGDRPADLPQRMAFGKALRRLLETDAEAHRVVTQIGHFAAPPTLMAESGVQARVVALVQQQSALAGA